MVHKSKIAAFREWLMTEAAQTVEEGRWLTCRAGQPVKP
jgi:hypothetical protein